MRIVRVLAFIFALLITVTEARAGVTDPLLTFIQPLKTAPREADVFLGVPRDLDLEKKITIVVYFHGLRPFESFEAMLARQRIAEQVAEAQANAVVVAPLMPYPIKKKDRKPFAGNGDFKKFLREASVVLAKTLNVSPVNFTNARIVIIGYSAGHMPMRSVLSRDDAAFDGIVLLDAHYGSQHIFAHSAARIARRGTGFFITARSKIQDYRGGQFEDALTKEKISFVRQLPSGPLLPGLVVVLKVDGEYRHYDFVTSAWSENPITDVLKKAYGN